MSQVTCLTATNLLGRAPVPFDVRTVMMLLALQEGDLEARRLVETLGAADRVTTRSLREDRAVRRLVVLDVDAIPALEDALRSERPTVRAAAAFTLGHIGRVEALRRLYVSEKDPVARLIIVTLFQWCGRGAVPALERHGLDSAAFEKALADVTLPLPLSDAERVEQAGRIIAALRAAPDDRGLRAHLMRRAGDIGPAMEPLLRSCLGEARDAGLLAVPVLVLVAGAIGLRPVTTSSSASSCSRG
jgi:hypothetical protein